MVRWVTPAEYAEHRHDQDWLGRRSRDWNYKIPPSIRQLMDEAEADGDAVTDAYLAAHARRPPDRPRPSGRLPDYDRGSRDPERPCDVCGRLPTGTGLGVCRRTTECAAEFLMRQEALHYLGDLRTVWAILYLGLDGSPPMVTEAVPCPVCTELTRSPSGACHQTIDCSAESSRRARLLDEVTNMPRGSWPLLGPFTVGGSRIWRWVLVIRQQYICPRCTEALDRRDAESDHIIPVSRGGPNEMWNLQALHWACNQEKGNELTPQAAQLAAEHGIALREPLPRGGGGA
jgi:5-methylcytosine-specific restriction endonuclease McrA